jgi:hypothetical protein
MCLFRTAVSKRSSPAITFSIRYLRCVARLLKRNSFTMTTDRDISGWHSGQIIREFFKRRLSTLHMAQYHTELECISSHSPSLFIRRVNVYRWIHQIETKVDWAWSRYKIQIGRYQIKPWLSFQLNKDWRSPFKIAEVTPYFNLGEVRRGRVQTKRTHDCLQLMKAEAMSWEELSGYMRKHTRTFHTKRSKLRRVFQLFDTGEHRSLLASDFDIFAVSFNDLSLW